MPAEEATALSVRDLLVAEAVNAGVPLTAVHPVMAEPNWIDQFPAPKKILTDPTSKG